MNKPETSNKNPGLKIRNLDIADIELSVLKSIRDPLGIFSTDFKVLWMNKSMAYIHQAESGKLTGKSCYFDLCKEAVSCTQCPIVHVRDSGKMFITERFMDFPDGQRRWGEVRSYPLKDAEKNVIAVIVLIVEITKTIEDSRKRKEYTDLLLKELIASSGSEKRKISNKDTTLNVRLTVREVEVLRLLTEGFTNNHISGILSISNNTVKRHIDNIFNKLGVNDRTQAAVAAVRFKLI